MTALWSILGISSFLVHFLAQGLSIGRLSDAEDIRPTAASTTIVNECNLDNLPFYVLNLDRRREDKLVEMEKVMERDAPWMCEKTCRVNAPDGQLWGHLNVELKRGIVSAEQWQLMRNAFKYGTHAAGLMTPGALALFAGHGRMWEHLLQDEAPFAVIMEDDLSTFHPGTKSFLCSITQNQSLAQGWDFMIMQSHMQSVDASKTPIFKSGEHVFNTGMYIIKLDAVRKLLRASFPVTEHCQLDAPTSPLWTTLRGAHTIPALADASHAITDVQTQSLLNNASATGAGRCSIHDCKALDVTRMVIPELANPVKGYSSTP